MAEARPFPPLEEGEIDVINDISDEEAFQFFEDPYGEDQRQQEAFEQGMSILQGLTQEANNAIRKIKTFLLLNDAFKGLSLVQDPKIEYRFDEPDLGFTDIFYSSSEEEEEEEGN